MCSLYEKKAFLIGKKYNSHLSLAILDINAVKTMSSPSSICHVYKKNGIVVVMAAKAQF
jgi:hypothetical protein